MANRNSAWGIEVGANALKAVHLVRSGDNINLAHYEVMPFKQILTTPDLNVDEQIQLMLDEFQTRHDLTKSNVLVSLPGHSAFARFAKLPPVEPKQIPSIVKFEAQQQIPFPIDQVEWDYQVFQEEDSPDVQVGIFAITKDRVAEVLNNYRASNLRIDGMTLSPLAVYNALAFDWDLDEDSAGLILLDIGTTSTDLIIVEPGGIWLRTMPIGGTNFTNALMKAFKLPFTKAEKLKREARTSKYAKQIFQAMRPVFADFVQEIQKSLGYYQSINRDADLKQLVGMGSTFRLPGMQKFLKQQLQLDIIRIEEFKQVEVDEKIASNLAEDAINLMTAYGLAVQGLDLEEVDANLIPKATLKQRVWKSKQPWFLAASILLLLTGIGVIVSEQISKARFEQGFEQIVPGTQQPISDYVSQVISKGNEYQQRINTIQAKDNRRQIEQLRELALYQDLWPKIIEDISLATQQLEPDKTLWSSNYSAWEAADFSKSKRIFITELKPTYKPPQQQVYGTPAAPGGNPNMGNANNMGDPSMQPGMQPGQSGMPATPPAASTGNKQPTYTVVIKGFHLNTERYGEALTEEFKKTLSEINTGDSAKTRLYRPYEIKNVEVIAGPTQMPYAPVETTGTTTTKPRMGGGFGDEDRRFGGGGFGDEPGQNKPTINLDPAEVINFNRQIERASQIMYKQDGTPRDVYRFTISFDVVIESKDEVKQEISKALQPTEDTEQTDPETSTSLKTTPTDPTRQGGRL